MTGGCRAVPYAWRHTLGLDAAGLRTYGRARRLGVGHAQALAAARRYTAALSSRPRRVIELVGPKGYIHGWIFVGIPVAGQQVNHPHLGSGVVTGTRGGRVSVRFDRSGAEHSFEHRPASQPGKLAARHDAYRIGVYHQAAPSGAQMTTQITPEGTGSTARVTDSASGKKDTLTVSGMSDDGHVMVHRESRYAGETGPPLTYDYRLNDVKYGDGDVAAAAKSLLPAGNRLEAQATYDAKADLGGIYGDQAHLADTPQMNRAAIQLAQHVPAPMHQLLARKGWQLHTTEGPVTDVLTDLRGVHSAAHDATHPGQPITWDQVQGVTDSRARQYVVGGGARDDTALHEAAHALDHAAETTSVGLPASATPDFMAIYHQASKSGALTPYYKPRPGPGGITTGRTEFFAESFGAWLKNRDKPAAGRRAAMSVALNGGYEGSRVTGMLALDRYYKDLYGKLQAA